MITRDNPPITQTNLPATAGTYAMQLKEGVTCFGAQTPLVWVKVV